jgi:hypothetical protein
MKTLLKKIGVRNIFRMTSLRISIVDIHFKAMVFIAGPGYISAFRSIKNAEHMYESGWNY